VAAWRTRPPSALMSEKTSMSFRPSSAKIFSPRVGKIVLNRPTGSLQFLTPGLLTSTSRGIVPHLSGDHIKSTPEIRWLSVHFESL
jgi:queuine tRNA-ribosyltransferase